MKRIRSSIAKSLSLLLAFAAAFGIVFLIQWCMENLGLPRPYLTMGDGRTLPVYTPWWSLLPCVVQNCAAYALWSLGLAWLFKGMRETFFAPVERWRWRTVAIDALFAVVFTLQLLLTESVADAACGWTWLHFLGAHTTGWVCLCLLAACLAILAGHDRKPVGYAVSACLAYAAMTASATLLPVSRTLFKAGLAACMFCAFAVFTFFRRKEKDVGPIRRNVSPSRLRTTTYAAAFLAVCAAYVAGIDFWRRQGRKNDAFLLEERFFQARAPFSVQGLRTEISTERDAIRARIMGVPLTNNSFVEAGVAFMSNPEEYGADPAVTNLLGLLARDADGRVLNGFTALEGLALKPFEATGEFAKNLERAEGKLSDVKIPGEVVERITGRARNRMRDPGGFPVNLFYLYTRDNEIYACHIGRDTYNAIKILNGVDSVNVSSNGTYGAADVNLQDIVAFKTVDDPGAMLNECLCMSVVGDTLERMFGYSYGGIPFHKRLREMLAHPVEHWSFFRESLLQEEEVDELRQAFIAAVNAKKGLTPTGFTRFEGWVREILFLASVLAIYAPKKRWIGWAKQFRPKSKFGLAGLTFLILICIVATLQLKTYIAMWKQKKGNMNPKTGQ